MRILSNIVLLLCLCVGLSGCFEEKIKSLVDKEFPPIEIAQQRATAVELGQKALVNLRDASFVASFDMNDIRAAIELLELEHYNVTDIKVEADQQMILVDLSVGGVFDSKVVPGLELDQAELLDLARPEIVGSLRFGVSIGTEIVESDVLLRVLPIFSEVKFEKLELLGVLDIAKPAEFITAVVNKFSDNISGELTRAEFTKIRFPTSPVKEIDFTSSSSQGDDAGNSVDLRVEAKPLSEPIHIGQSAVLIQSDSVVIILVVSPTALPAPDVAEFEGSVEFADFQANFSAVISEMLPATEQPEGTWAVVAKGFLASVMNKAVNDSELCFSGNAVLAKQTFSEKIEIPDENVVNCTPDRNCQQTNDCRQTEDCRQTNDCRQTGSCRACLLRAPFTGHCIQHGNDPICEARKVGRRVDCERLKEQREAACEAGKVTRRLDCERLKETRRLTCEGEKAAEKGLCEVGKEALKRLSRTGNLANINGGVQGTGSVEICVRKFLVSDDVSTLALSLDAEGSATAEASVKFVPLDIVGHLLCQFPFTEDKTVSVNIPRQGIDINSDLAFENTVDGLKITTETSASDIGAKISPSPRDLILQSYNMTLACAPVAGLLHPINLSVGSVVPEMKGDISIPVDKITNEMIVEPFELLAGEDGPKIKLSFFVSDKSFGGVAVAKQ
ncbi:hypothetical protein K3553_04340 [Leisingera aquaemixtae]|uniref:hypothetical protein n=1 Tax=Leisingera aquaemixtae TaxID=1396826 RepID=UPI0021A33C0B|nr:hypothetical protein [Leisingera aquaemixtae]UWQ25697.1 hypothetical protein K3553_04340 [Leisingera aquaemixtae]